MARPWRKPRITPDDDIKYREFAGLINTHSEKDIGWRGLTIADNVLITDSKKIRVRPGNSLFRSGAMQTAYVNRADLYIVDAGTLQRLVSTTDAHTILAGLTRKSYCWDSVNGQAYFVNGIEAGILDGDTYLPLRVPAPIISSVVEQTVGGQVRTPFNLGAKYTRVLWRFCATYELADGRESAPSEVFEVWAAPEVYGFTATVSTNGGRVNVYATEPDGTVLRLAASYVNLPTFSVWVPAAGRELTTSGTSPLPEGVDQIVYWQGKLYVAQYFSDADQSVIWSSRTFAYHLYDMGKDYMVVPGRVSMMLWTQKELSARTHNWLLIGTTQLIAQLTEDGRLETIVNYGVLPGTAGDLDADSTAYFWTTRGFCKSPPFENLTEKNVGMPPGLRANTQLVYLDGMQQLVTITQGGGTPFNVRS